MSLASYFILRRNQEMKIVFESKEEREAYRQSLGDRCIGHLLMMKPFPCLNENNCEECWEMYTYIEDGGNKCVASLEEDVVNYPSHYETGKFQCIDMMIDDLGAGTVLPFCVANAYKYLWRAAHKNGYEDIRKAHWYLNYVSDYASLGNHVCVGVRSHMESDMDIDPNHVNLLREVLGDDQTVLYLHANAFTALRKFDINKARGYLNYAVAILDDMKKRGIK